VNIQRSLGRDMVLEVAYAGNKGTHLALSSQLDQLHPAQLALGNALLDQVPILTTASSRSEFWRSRPFNAGICSGRLPHSMAFR